jgi:hypothetical protein
VTVAFLLATIPEAFITRSLCAICHAESRTKLNNYTDKADKKVEISPEAIQKLLNSSTSPESIPENVEPYERAGAAERHTIESGYLIGFKSADT